MSDYNGYQPSDDQPGGPPNVPDYSATSRPPEGKGDDQGDHEIPTPAPSTDAPSPTATPSPSPSDAPSSSTPATEAPSSTYPTEPADQTTGVDAGPGASGEGLPVTSGPDVWLGFTFVLCAALAVVAGAVMTRAAKRLGQPQP